MKGWRFYEEFETSKRKVSQGNVVAVSTTQEGVFTTGGIPKYECVSAVMFFSNSPVAFGSVGILYIEERCKRISEAKAREIHPMLFKYLEGG